MSVFYNLQEISDISKCYLILDNNILASCFSNLTYLDSFVDLFKPNPKLIDPIVRLEFLRGAYAQETYLEKKKFLSFNEFYPMADHQQIYIKVIENSIKIAHILTHKGHPDIEIADILITSRLMEYPDYLLLTINYLDFPSFIFDRISIVSIEKINKKKEIIVENIHLLKFNREKFESCFSELPQVLKENSGL